LFSILAEANPTSMRTVRRRFAPHSAKLIWRVAAAVLQLLPLGLWAQTDAGNVSPVDALPQDTGKAGFTQSLRKLETTARLLQIDAHPDDEDGGMLTLESRGKGVSVTLLTLNRGEGGQNKVGSNLFDVLGVLRSLEVMAADRYYGVDQRFTLVSDFGYSKSPEETFQKWGGHDVALSDIVRVIRTFRPDVLVARFSGTNRDGHGHHQASAMLTREAFRAAADPNRFPEQIEEGLLPWQAKKLYVGNVCGFGAMTCDDENYTVKLNTGAPDPVLGMSYAQFAMAGLKHQLSQGAGAWTLDPGDRFTFYKLVDSVLAAGTQSVGHEQNFFDGMDTTLPGLARRLGDDAPKLPDLQSELSDIAAKIRQASGEGGHNPSRAAPPLLAALQSFGKTISAVERSSLDARTKLDILTVLRDKRQQCETAADIAMGVSLESTVAPPGGPEKGLPAEAEALTVVSPGQKLTVLVRLHNGSKYPLRITDLSLQASPGWVTGVYKGDNRDFIRPKEDFYANFRLSVPANAEATRPYWHRADPERDAVATRDSDRYATLPFPPSPLRVRVAYQITGRQDLALMGHQIKGTEGPGAAIATSVVVPFRDAQGSGQKRALAVAPAFSVIVDPGSQVIAVQNTSATNVKVSVTSNLSEVAKGDLHLVVPSGWRVEPSGIPVEFHSRGEAQSFAFKITPESLTEGRAEIQAVLESGEARYSEGYSLVTREDLGSFYYYQPATQRISIVDVKIPQDLRVAYVMGAGDNIPTVLQQMGMDVTQLPAEKLASEDLGRYGTIVLGIRAYDTQKDVASQNRKLLDYVANGGTLVVQYNAATGDFNSGHFTPYPAQLTRTRVSVEQAPVDILDPDDGIFQSPNQITEKDFDGWVQERGLYFMSDWDSHFKPLLASHDPGEAPQKGGLLRARYGKGTYIYTGYAFFRQLPAGVPGAIRLYANLLNAGHPN
jgi:LmbE family N-acetylglucosaminyl deacetylase